MLTLESLQNKCGVFAALRRRDEWQMQTRQPWTDSVHSKYGVQSSKRGSCIVLMECVELHLGIHLLLLSVHQADHRSST
jgi:hypothetical protein